MLRILHVSTRLILGGSQENTVLSCEGQARLGHEVHLAFGPIYGPEGSLLQRIERFNDACRSGAETTAAGGACRPITTHTVPRLVRELRPFADLRAYHELRALIAVHRPDVVHTHSSKAGILGRAAAWNSDPRPAVVHTIHGPPFMPVEGSALARLKTRLLNEVYTRAERYAARRCHLLIAVADAMTAQFRARGIGRPEQYLTVRSGMEIEPYLHAAPGADRESQRRELGLGPDDFVIGTIARLAQHKGHDDLLDALAEDLRANSRYKLLWVGDGWWRERLVARARTLGLRVRELDRPATPAPAASTESAHILLTGLVPPERVPALIRAMDVLAHPSTREGLPRTVPQALLCGVPAVAYDIDGTREVCVNGVTGILLPRPDPAALRAALARLYSHPDERRVLGQHGRDFCRTQFDARRMVADLDEAYARARALLA